MVWLDPEGNPKVQVGLTADGRPVVTGLDRATEPEATDPPAREVDAP